jgi:hypothetical protein
MRPHIKQFVFRVSNGNNEGPFRNRKGRDPFHNSGKFNNPRLYPNFYDDGIRSYDYEQVAALPNACALFHWFGEDLDVLNRNKFRVHRIEVKNMCVGRSGHQVTYHRRFDKVGKMQVVPIKYKGLLL